MSDLRQYLERLYYMVEVHPGLFCSAGFRIYEYIPDAVVEVEKDLPCFGQIAMHFRVGINDNLSGQAVDGRGGPFMYYARVTQERQPSVNGGFCIRPLKSRCFYGKAEGRVSAGAVEYSSPFKAHLDWGVRCRPRICGHSSVIARVLERKVSGIRRLIVRLRLTLMKKSVCLVLAGASTHRQRQHQQRK